PHCGFPLADLQKKEEKRSDFAPKQKSNDYAVPTTSDNFAPPRVDGQRSIITGSAKAGSFNGLRWILILPAAVGALLGITIITNLFGGLFGGHIDAFWIQLANSAMCGYFFVLAGARTAPSSQAKVAVILTIILCVALALTGLSMMNDA